jgi:hypothetical protein
LFSSPEAEGAITFDPVAPDKPVSIKTISSRLSKRPEDGMATRTFDFLFGPEAAVIGIAHDTEGWSWNVDNVRKQWSEEPLWVNALATTSLIGTMILPATLAARSTMKFGKGLTALKAGTKAEKTEIDRWIGKGFDDDGEQIKAMLDPDRFKSAKSYADIDDKTIEMLRRQEFSNNNYKKMKLRADRAEGAAGLDAIPLTKSEALRHGFDKRFSQTYNAMIDGARNNDIKNQFHDMHQRLWQNDTMGTILREMPGPGQSDAIYGYILGEIAPGAGLAAKAAGRFGKLTAKNKEWADFYLAAARKRQDEMLESGFITQEMYMRVGPAHLPALSKGTPDLGIGATTTHLIPIKPARGAKKTRATGLVKEREKGLLGEKTVFNPAGVEEYETIAVRVANKPRLTSNTLKHRSGDHTDIFGRLEAGELITDPAEMTVQGYINDGILHTNYQFITDMVTQGSGKNIMTNATMKAAGWDARQMAKMGYVRMDDAGEGPTAILRRMIAKKTGMEEEALPWMKKQVYEGIFGKEGMMYQGDRITGNMMDVMTTIYKTMKTALNPATHFQNLTGNISFLYQAGFNSMAPKNLKLMGEMTHTFNDYANMTKAANRAGLKGKDRFKGIKLGTVETGGKKFDMLEELTDPAVRELMEESAFESVEGSAHLLRLKDALREDQYFTKGFIDKFLKGKSLAQGKDKLKWFDTMTKAYLAEDMIPKMTYFMHLRGKGLTRAAAVTEVARRLPMYGTVGSAIKYGRKFAFPWATFPAEAMRITKNNMMDHPLRMIPWLRAPQISQTILSGMGWAGDPQEVSDVEKQLPTWAQKHTTIIGTGKAIAGLAGAGTGGVVGAVAGAAMTKSARGAYMGAAIGGGGLGLAAVLGMDEAHGNEMRGALLDFLPHSTFLLSSTSVAKHGTGMLPWRDAAGMLEQMPADPLAILKPMVQAFTGEDSNGKPVEGGLGKTMAGILGFMAPPFIQKYGFRLTTPDVPLWGDPTGLTNISKAMIDTGNAIDPMTGRPGSMTTDFLLNNLGIFKSYQATGEQQLANEQIAEKHLTKVRNHLSKNLDFHTSEGNEKDVIDILTDIQGTYAEQYIHNPMMAQNKYTEWLQRHRKQLGQLPGLRGWSDDELEARLERAGRMAGSYRNKAREQLLQALRDAQRMKSEGR